MQSYAREMDSEKQLRNNWKFGIKTADENNQVPAKQFFFWLNRIVNFQKIKGFIKKKFDEKLKFNFSYHKNR